jgi:hypothetical protein
MLNNTVAQIDREIDLQRRCRDRALDPIEWDGFNERINELLDERNQITRGVPVAQP